MEAYMIFVWIGVIVLSVVLEAVTVQMVSIWFIAGGVVGLIANALNIPVWPQVLIAAVVTLILLTFTRRFVLRKLSPKKTNTNADRHIGEVGVVVDEICNLENRGQVKIKGSIWTARSEIPEVIPNGKLVRVLRIEGVKLIVSPTEQ